MAAPSHDGPAPVAGAAAGAGSEAGDEAVGITEPAPAKVNLTLQILGRRADGYHLVDSLIVFAACGDHLEAIPADGLSLEVSGPFASALVGQGDNLVLRAARLLAEAAEVPARARLSLHKSLPVAAGLGGGSADAAAALRALARLWQVGLSEVELYGLAAGLGADVPACLYGRPVFAGGIGEDLTPAPPLPPAWLLLVNPGVALATATVFQARQGHYSAPCRWDEPLSDAAALAARLALAGNDLELSARRLCPEVEAVLDALTGQDGCLLARMTGSGSTCFGLFEGGDDARRAAAALAAARPDWWVRAAPMLDGEEDPV